MGTDFDVVIEAKRIFDTEINALEKTRDTLDDGFSAILNEVLNCNGKVILCGMGKSGHIAKKISATMASLGTPSFFLHPAEAMHGDLGMVSEQDLVILISHSGESREVVRLIPSLKIIGAKLVAITANADSTLARECELVQVMPDVQEACDMNLAPTSSTTAVLVYGDALAVVAAKSYGFNEQNFALFHPAGTLGKKILLKVNDIMAKEDDIPMVQSGTRISDAIMEMSSKKLGVVTIVDGDNKLLGLLTDGDLRRAIEKKVDMYTDDIDKIMTVSPKSIKKDILAVQALQKLKIHSINNFPVIDDENHVIGVLTWQMIIKEGIVL
jgi:arabinose-5-phosphate isomerase